MVRTVQRVFRKTAFSKCRGTDVCSVFVSVSQAFDALEFFCGAGNVSRCLKYAGHSVGSFDIKLGTPLPGKQNAMDLLSDAGMASFGFTQSMHSMCFFGGVFRVSVKDFNAPPRPRLALSAVLGAVEDKCLVIIGIVCSSFVLVSSGTHGRTPFDPLGKTQFASVRDGNVLASRTLG